MSRYYFVPLYCLALTTLSYPSTSDADAPVDAFDLAPSTDPVSSSCTDELDLLGSNPDSGVQNPSGACPEDQVVSDDQGNSNLSTQHSGQIESSVTNKMDDDMGNTNLGANKSAVEFF